MELDPKMPNKTHAEAGGGLVPKKTAPSFAAIYQQPGWLKLRHIIAIRDRRERWGGWTRPPVLGARGGWLRRSLFSVTGPLRTGVPADIPPLVLNKKGRGQGRGSCSATVDFE